MQVQGQILFLFKTFGILFIVDFLLILIFFKLLHENIIHLDYRVFGVLLKFAGKARAFSPALDHE